MFRCFSPQPRKPDDVEETTKCKPQTIGQTMKRSFEKSTKPSAKPPGTERRMRNSEDWYQGICDKFKESTGWELIFTPVDASNTDETPDIEILWSAEVTDGRNRIGHLKLTISDTSVSDSEFESVRLMADLIASLLNRVARGVHALELRSRDVATLVKLALSTPNEGSLLRTLQEILRACVQLTEFRGACFFLLDPKTQALNIRGAYDLDSTQVPQRKRDLSAMPPDLKALTDGFTILHRSISAEAAEWLPDGYSTGLGIAVQSENVPLGTLWLFDRRTRTPDDSETELLLSLGVQLAQILERVVLLRESKTTHRLKRDLAQVVEDQSADTTRLEISDGSEIVALCQSRYEVGGDLCEVIPLNEHQTYVAIGDAVGNGISAAVIKSTLKGAVAAVIPEIARHRMTVEQSVERLNDALLRVTPAHRFMSFLCGILDTRKKTFSYSNAGHLAPLHAHDGQVDTLQSHGLILGIQEGAAYGQSTVPLNSGDLLVMFSDGIVEAKCPDQTLLTNDGVIDALNNNRIHTADDAMNAILAKYQEHVGAGEEADDRTLCVVRAA